jgi:hypothetical protein
MMNVFQRIAQLGNRALTDRLLPPPSYLSIDGLAKLYSSLPRLKFHDPPDAIGGWMSFNEQKTLYSLARFSSGPILEIGPWLGRSTVCIARGIRQRSIKAVRHLRVGSDSEELSPDRRSPVGFFYPEESRSPWVLPIDTFERDIRPFERPEGLLGQPRQPERMNVGEPRVDTCGDFRSSPLTSRFVFIDPMHDRMR